jgi:hypothetical protein
MLDDPRPRDMVRRFHHQWFETSKIADLTRDQRLFPTFGPETSDSMMEEVS